MTRDEAIAFLDAGTNAPAVRPTIAALAPPVSPAAIVPARESTLSYLSRSPIVQDVTGNISRGARLLGREAARDIGAGWDAATAVPRYAASELNRTIVQPLREEAGILAGDVAGAVGAGFRTVAGAAGRATGTLARYANENVIQPATSWFNRRVVPPELVPAPPDPSRRVVGQVYLTQIGPKLWTGEGWASP